MRNELLELFLQVRSVNALSFPKSERKKSAGCGTICESRYNISRGSRQSVTMHIQDEFQRCRLCQLREHQIYAMKYLSCIRIFRRQTPNCAFVDAAVSYQCNGICQTIFLNVKVGTVALQTSITANRILIQTRFHLSLNSFQSSYI